MSEKFWIILIVAVAVLLVVLMLRKKLKKLVLKGLGMEAEVETHVPDNARSNLTESVAPKRAGVNISNVNQHGSDNLIDVGRGDVNVEKIQQKDKGKIIVRPDQPNQEQK